MQIRDGFVLPVKDESVFVPTMPNDSLQVVIRQVLL
jgi:hypothetical protein